MTYSPKESEIRPSMLQHHAGRSSAGKVLLSREEIVRQALELVDQKGVGALSMRNIARSLGVSPGTLYPYIFSKECLINDLIDQLWVELDIEMFDVQWQEALQQMAHAMRDIFKGHQDIAKLTLGRIPMGPNFAVLLEALIAMFVREGLPGSFAFQAGDLIGLYTAAFVYEEYLQKDSGCAHDHVSAFASFLESLPQERFPHIHASLTEGFDKPFDRFSLGLDVLIAGLDRSFYR